MATTRSIFGVSKLYERYFVLDEVKCTGDESNILECQHPTFSVHDCSVERKEEAGVLCGVTQGLVYCI